ncbi:MAG TPA: glycosyltransferase family 1 protein [Blastocatellia bacterium]|nr:glycosyltransferase family 1 protein [Blastocatellia bacterium]
MSRVLINALASTAGGGITYLRNVLPRLERRDNTNRYFVLAPPGSLNGQADFDNGRVIIEPITTRGGAIGRMLWEQTRLPFFIDSRRIDALVSLGNFALFGARVPQILFNRNDLYFSPEFERDLVSRKQYGSLVSHRLKSLIARASIKRAEINVTPTTAFADRIRASDGLSGVSFEALHFGFDPDIFTACEEPLPEWQSARLKLNENRQRLLFVSHYNYYRNFETLIRALPIIKQRIAESSGKKILLALTTDIKRDAVYGEYDATAASDLIDELGIREDIAMLGAIDYAKLRQVYRACDLFVYPSYADSFGHTLLEAMSSGLPVASSDCQVHREICGDAALYFDTFNEKDLAEKCVSMLMDRDLRAKLIERGLERSTMFSWDAHVNGLIELIERCSTLSPKSANGVRLSESRR